MTGFRNRIAPRGNAAVGDFRIILREVHVGIEFPDFFARCGIEGDDVVVLGGEEECLFDENGRGFKSGFSNEVGFDFESPGAVGPGDLELSDVGFVDLCG